MEERGVRAADGPTVAVPAADVERSGLGDDRRRRRRDDDVTATSIFDRGNRYPAEGYEPADLPLIKTRLAAWSLMGGAEPARVVDGAGGGRP